MIASVQFDWRFLASVSPPRRHIAVVFSSLTLLPWLTAVLYGPHTGLSGTNGLMTARLTSLKVLTLNLRPFSVLGRSTHDVVSHI